MTVLLYIIAAIGVIALTITALFYLVKGFFVLLGWFLRLLPTMIKAAMYFAIIALIWSMLKDRFAVPRLPGAVYLLLYFVIIGLILARRYSKHGYIFRPSGGDYQDYKGYVLNKKSKVIHQKYSDSERTIGSHHKKEISYSEAMNLINNNEKYHFKK